MLTARWQALMVLRLPPSYQSCTCGLLQKFLGCQMCGHLGRLSGHIGLVVVKCVVTSDFELNCSVALAGPDGAALAALVPAASSSIVRPLFIFLSHSLNLSPPLFPSLSLSLSLAHTFVVYISLTLLLSPSFSRSLSLTHALYLYFSLSHSLTLVLSLSAKKLCCTSPLPCCILSICRCLGQEIQAPKPDTLNRLQS